MRRGAGDLEGNQERGARARHGFDDMPIVGAGGTTGMSEESVLAGQV